MNAYILLALSIGSEIFATTMLKYSDGFTVFWPSFAVVFGYSISFFLLGVVLKTLPLSLAYAIWSGVGTAVTAIISILLWGEVFTVLKILGLVLIIGGVIALNSSSEPKQEIYVLKKDYAQE
ncbi:MAG: multidrug efflux SMR transporter [Solibacillus sp.]